MSIKLMQMVWENAPCRENSLLILLALADWANDDGVCWPSMQTLADKARVDRRSAQRIVRKLISENLLTVDEGRGRAHQHKYTIEKAALCRPPTIKGDIDDRERAALETEKAAFPTQKATRVSPDPLVEPSEKEPSIDLPYCGDRFLAALSAFEKHRAAMRKPLTKDAVRLLYSKLGRWDESTAVVALEDAVINNWQGVFEPRINGLEKAGVPAPTRPVSVENSEARMRRENCTRCWGTGNEVIPGKGARICDHEPRSTNANSSTIRDSKEDRQTRVS